MEKFLDAEFPVGMTFTPAGELLYVEKATGAVRLVRADGSRRFFPVMQLDVNALQERGMQSITLDPGFATNRQVWLYFTAAGTERDFAGEQSAAIPLGGWPRARCGRDAVRAHRQRLPGA